MRGALVGIITLTVAASCGAVAPAPSSTPRVTPFVIPTRSPAPQVSAARFPGHYGWLVPTSAGYAVWRQGDIAPLATIALFDAAVSPDGRRVAGFTAGTPASLAVADVASPTAITRITALAADERASGLVWSADGTGLLYAVARDVGRGPPAWSALRTIDTVARIPNEVARLDGAALDPALWDRRGGDLVGAFVVNGGVAVEYVVIRGVQSPERRALPDKAWHAAVSGDAGWIVLASSVEPVLRTFRADDPSFIVETHALSDAAVSAVGRPMTGQIGLALDGQLILWDPATGGRGRVPTATAVSEIVGFRFDGSAAVVRTSTGLALVDVTTYVSTPIDLAGLGIALP